MLTVTQIREHYRRPEIAEIITNLSTFPEGSRACMICDVNGIIEKDGSKRDHMIWYTNNRKGKYPAYCLDLSDRKQYKKNIYFGRTLYWTLNIFHKNVYAIDYRHVQSNESSKVSRTHTVGYTFGVDIDREHGCNITDSEVKKSVELMAQYYVDIFKKYCPDSVYCLFSGGGIYVMLDHRTFKAYFERFRDAGDWDKMLMVLLNAFDDLINSIRDDFFKQHPECKGKVKPDALNGSKRVFKAIFSVHKTLDFAVIPLNPDKVEINFERASLPLSDEIIEEGKKVFSKYSDGTDFLNLCLKPYLLKAYEESSKAFNHADIPNINNSDSPIAFDQWAPCMKNLYKLPICGEGQTRALAVMVSYLHQIGYNRDKAYSIFTELVDRWGARASNIFESYWDSNMSTPTCARLISNDNRGFPKGVSLKYLNICKPDQRCLQIPSPRYYADHTANKQRLKNKLKSRA